MEIDKDLLQKVNRYFDYASELAIILIEKTARKILSDDDKNLHEFVMANGTCFFTAKDNGKYDINSYDDLEYDEYIENGGVIADSHGIMSPNTFQIEFFELVDDLNEKFNVCGVPMRFTAYGNIVKKW